MKDFAQNYTIGVDPCTHQPATVFQNIDGTTGLSDKNLRKKVLMDFEKFRTNREALIR